MIDVEFASAEQCAQKKSREEEYGLKFEYVIFMIDIANCRLGIRY
jgi:hypothetical protein